MCIILGSALWYGMDFDKPSFYDQKCPLLYGLGCVGSTYAPAPGDHLRRCTITNIMGTPVMHHVQSATVKGRFVQVGP